MTDPGNLAQWGTTEQYDRLLLDDGYTDLLQQDKDKACTSTTDRHEASLHQKDSDTMDAMMERAAGMSTGLEEFTLVQTYAWPGQI